MKAIDMNYGLTRFFRNRAQLKTFEYYVIPEIIKKKERQGCPVLRIWSAGCSTGEEPYTIAMLCNELLPAEYRLEISASDLNAKALETAREGLYPEQAVSEVSKRYLQKYFVHEPLGYRLRDGIRESVTYIHRDLKADSGLAPQDVVFFRNVSMYHDQSTRRSMLDELWTSMDVDAFLFVGDSESLFAMDTRFVFVHTDWSCLFKKTGV